MNIGWVEVVLVVGLVVLVFGPKRIPLLGSALGKTLRGFKEELKTGSSGELKAGEAARLETETKSPSKIIDR